MLQEFPLNTSISNRSQNEIGGGAQEPVGGKIRRSGVSGGSSQAAFVRANRRLHRVLQERESYQRFDFVESFWFLRLYMKLFVDK